MARKKKVVSVSFEDKMIEIAKDTVKGVYGTGITQKQKINSLGYGCIYSTVKKYANMIIAGQL